MRMKWRRQSLYLGKRRKAIQDGLKRLKERLDVGKIPAEN